MMMCERLVVKDGKLVRLVGLRVVERSSPTWQRLNVDRTPGRYSRWEWPGKYSQPPSFPIFPGIWRAADHLMRYLPPECVSPRGKMRLLRPDMTVTQAIHAIAILVSRSGGPVGDEAKYKEAINYVLDAPAEEIETMLEMAALDRLVVK